MINPHKLTFKQTLELYMSLREQYLSDRPITFSEEETMWACSHCLTLNGYNWFKIKSSQIRK